jgi:hypothetical protein
MISVVIALPILLVILYALGGWPAVLGALAGAAIVNIPWRLYRWLRDRDF